MNTDDLEPDDPLRVAVGTLREGEPVVPGLADRTRRRARRQVARRWTGGALGLAAVLAIGVIATRQTDPADGVTFTLALATPTGEGVSLVGDFNDWERDRIRLEPVGHDQWKVTVKLPPGRYRYSYVTDDGTWLADPDAPPALDEFGTPTSVVTVTSE